MTSQLCEVAFDLCRKAISYPPMYVSVTLVCNARRSHTAESISWCSVVLLSDDSREVKYAIAYDE